jgi:tRNA/tmRNA/rRNA uracil-C5-methylase (TrmA/RlmC/RlmD family)
LQPPPPPPAEGYAALVGEVLRREGMPAKTSSHPEPLAQLEYDLEYRAKDEAWARWWKGLGFGGVFEPLVAASQPRGYRTTSKRKVRRAGSGVDLGFAGDRLAGGTVVDSQLDHPTHLPIYAAVAELFGRPGFSALAPVSSWVIVRGVAPALTVILNVVRFDAAVIRAARRIGEALSELGARSVLLYLDPTGSEYYLEAKRPAKTLGLKVICGSEWLQTEIGGIRLRHPAVSFAQVNAAMVPTLVETVARLAGPLAGTTLLDCYCGWGLFAFTVGQRAMSVLGVDHDGPAIESARRTAERLGGKYRFVAAAVEPDFVRDGLRRERGPEVVILDPPRQGTAKGLAEALAEREPARVVHVCCGIDELPRELTAWERAGWSPDRVVALDLFPGTTSIEVLVGLEQARAPQRRPPRGR